MKRNTIKVENGDTCMKIVKILDMAQATLTTARKRRKFLHEKPYSSNVEFKVKMTAWAKGWR